jgi:hypothetical protein
VDWTRLDTLCSAAMEQSTATASDVRGAIQSARPRKGPFPTTKNAEVLDRAGINGRGIDKHGHPGLAALRERHANKLDITYRGL